MLFQRKEIQKNKTLALLGERIVSTVTSPVGGNYVSNRLTGMHFCMQEALRQDVTLVVLEIPAFLPFLAKATTAPTLGGVKYNID